MCKAQTNNIEKVILKFEYFKSPNIECIIDYNNNVFTCTMKYKAFKDNSFQKSYFFTNKKFKKLKEELNKDIPNATVVKSEGAMDGGGFTINYIKEHGGKSKLTVMNPFRNNKYKNEFKKIDAFFDFAYSVVKDSLGVNALDKAYIHFFRGLPIRETSDNPLEYRVWGSISGNASMNKELITFFNSLPHDKCVIIDCNDELSYALQEDILRLYVLKNSNLHFVNNSYLKYTRESLLELREKIKLAGNNKAEFDKLKNTTTYDLYNSDAIEIDKWLTLPEKLIYSTVNEIRKNCH